MVIAAVISMFIIAVTPASEESWILTFLNYGVAGAMLVFFIWRDKRTEDRRDKEREKAYELQAENTKALNLMAKSTMAQIIALKHLDGAVAEMAANIQKEADSALDSIQSR